MPRQSNTKRRRPHSTCLMPRQSRTRERQFLKRIHLNAAGIDIGSRSHWVAVPEDRDERQ